MRRTLMAIALVLILGLEASSQRFVSPNARPKNATRFLDARDKYNEAAIKFNAEFAPYKTEWDMKPNKLLPHVQVMRDQLNKMEELLLHLDEEPE